MTILEEIKAGRLVVVPPVSVKPLEWRALEQARSSEDPSTEETGDYEASSPVGIYLIEAGFGSDSYVWSVSYENRFLFDHDDPDAAKAAAQADYEARILSALAASPDHTTGLVALVEGMEREIEKWRKADEVWGQPTAYLVDCSFKAEKHDAAEARALAAEAERDALRALICRVEPHIDAIVCYASAMGEHEPNRIAHEVRSIASGGVLRAAETGWLIELRGSAPSWAIVNPRDYDEHWTADSTRALRFARREDAQAYIDHIGWTEAFPSEHIWDDGRTHSDATRTEQP